MADPSHQRPSVDHSHTTHQEELLLSAGSKGRRLLLIDNSALAALATVFFLARVWAKRIRHLGWSVDDSLLLFALLCLYISVACAIWTVTSGHVGLRIGSPDASELTWTLKVLWAIQFPHIVAMTATRCSISILFIRLLFTKTFAKLRFAAFACIVITCTWLCVHVIITMLHCRPLKYNWTVPLENSTYCFGYKPYKLGMISCGVIIDTVIWSLPHVVVWRLQLRLAHKVAITAIFALGVLNIVVAILRIMTLINVPFDGDLTYNANPAMIWMDVQKSTAIILTCCPLLRPLFEKLIPKRLTRLTTPKHWAALKRSTGHSARASAQRSVERASEQQSAGLSMVQSTSQNQRENAAHNIDLERDGAILVTTRISLQPESSRLRNEVNFHDSLEEIDGPRFQVQEPRPRQRKQSVPSWIVSSAPFSWLLPKS